MRFCNGLFARLLTVGGVLYAFIITVAAAPKPDAIGDILGQLLALGLRLNQIDVTMSVVGLLVGSASLNFNATNPLPLIEMTIDQATMQLGQNGTTFFTFNHTFTNFIIPGLGSANSGTINDVVLTQGGLATLPLVQATSLDVIGATYSLRVLTVNGTGGVTVPLNTVQSGVPTDTTLSLLKG